jgi:hypothetical protein
MSKNLMGTWGPGNLDNDGTSDIRYEQSKQLVDEILKLAGSEAAAQFDEYDHDKLFVNLETFFALERAHLLNFYPDPDQVAELKESYLAAWDDYIKQNSVGWDERRAVIARTFDRLIWICQKEQRRVDESGQWVEVKPPTLSELANGLVLSPHLVFGDLHVSLPTSWNAHTWSDTSQIPASTLTHSLLDPASGRYSVKEHHFTVERVFFASGPSLVPDEVATADNPYLLIGRLRIANQQKMPDVYRFVCDTEEVLAPDFQGAGEHVSAVMRLDTLKGLDFDGLESFRHLKPGPEWGSRLRDKDLYYRQQSDDTLLLLEFGSIRDNIDFHFPDKVLLQHIVDSMGATSPPLR